MLTVEYDARRWAERERMHMKIAVTHKETISFTAELVRVTVDKPAGVTLYFKLPDLSFSGSHVSGVLWRTRVLEALKTRASKLTGVRASHFYDWGWEPGEIKRVSTPETPERMPRVKEI